MNFLEQLASRRRFGMRPGLDAIRRLCARMGNPQLRFRAIHVAGTNGKGAVCAILDAALRGSGLRVGRYTSPHLVKLNERFFLDGALVADAVLDRLAGRVHEALDPSSSQSDDLRELTFFEALTAVAFQLYAEASVDYAVLECGLGGRQDATNVCAPALCVITRIGLDHCDWLGDTVERIAAEKAGIVKPGVPVILGRNEPSVRAVVEAQAKKVDAPFLYAPDIADEREIPADFSLPGAFNRENAVTALAALKALSGCRQVPSAQWAALSHVTWPGRFQRVGDVLVDGAHNPPAARALAETLRQAGVRERSLDLVCGFCGDKDVETVLALLAPFAKRGLAVRTNNPRSLPAEEVAAKIRRIGLGAVACDSLRSALDAVRPASSQPTTELASLVCGSLFLAGEALVALDAYPWGEPRFDGAELLHATPSPGDGARY